MRNETGSDGRRIGSRRNAVITSALTCVEAAADDDDVDCISCLIKSHAAMSTACTRSAEVTSKLKPDRGVERKVREISGVRAAT